MFTDEPPITCSDAPIDDFDVIKELKNRNRALKMKIFRLKKRAENIKFLNNTKSKAFQMKSLASLEKQLKLFLTGTRLDFVLAQLRASQRRPRGQRWTSSNKSLAMSILHSSPKTYRLLQKAFAFPSVQTLRKAMNRMEIYPGFSKTILSALCKKVKHLPQMSKLVCVAVDEMAIKEGLELDDKTDSIEGFTDDKKVANHALVFVARGIVHQWKQPFGYLLSKEAMSGHKLKDLLMQAIEQLQQIGLQVVVTLSDQGSNNQNLFKSQLGVSVEKPFFLFEEQKIFVMYDPPHLIKSIRNNLHSNGYEMDGYNVEWKFIREFYEKDHSKPIQLAPKLTKKHLNLPPFSKLRVRLATQVLSHTVASGMKVMCQWGLISKDASHTADFLENFDRLFYVFNSNSLYSPAKMRHALSENSGHLEFLKKIYPWVEQLKYKGKRQLPCLNGWLLTMNALIQLWDLVHNRYGVKFLLTRQLNQDCVENLFSILRAKGAARDNPDAAQFRAALRQVMVDSVLLRGKMSNCEEDLDDFLFTLKNEVPEEDILPETSSATYIPVEIQNMTPILAVQASEVDLSLQEVNIITYIGGFIVRKLVKKVCSGCQKKIRGTLDNENAGHKFLCEKNYEGAKVGLSVPSVSLVEVLESMEQEYRAVIDDCIVQKGVKKSLLKAFCDKVDMSHFISNCCHLNLLVFQLYINIRLHHTIRLANRQLKETKSQKKKDRKALKFSNL